MELLSAKFLFDGKVLLKDVAVVLHNNKVADIGPKNILKKVYSLDVCDFGEGVLFPGFVNLHTHIELSYLKGKLPEGIGFVKWLKKIMEEKRKSAELQEIKYHMKTAVEELYKSGIRVVADISNTLYSCTPLRQYMPHSIVFFERYGLKKEKACEAKDSIESELEKYKSECEGLKVLPTAHSVYSTHRCLIEHLTSLNKNQPFSVHFLESTYEREFLSGKGELFDFLSSLDLIDDTFAYNDVFRYVKEAGFYRKNTIFVHCVDLKKEEIEKIKNIDATICLCLRSNEYISNQLPDIYKMEKSGINIGIGTDSLASNWDLDFIKEMGFIYKNFPDIRPETIFRWAISGGAKALGLKFGFKKDFIAYDVFIEAKSNEPLEEILSRQEAFFTGST